MTSINDSFFYRSTVFGCIQEWIGSIKYECNPLFFYWWRAGIREFFQWFWPIEYLYVISLLSKIESKIGNKSAFKEENCSLHNDRSTKASEFGIFNRCFFGKLSMPNENEYEHVKHKWNLSLCDPDSFNRFFLCVCSIKKIEMALIEQG